MAQFHISLWASIPVLAGFLMGFSGQMKAIAQDAHDHEHGAPYEHFYIGVDNAAKITRGGYAGLDNPNFGRLTWLFAHLSSNPATNHFHGIGYYGYSGPAQAPQIIFGNDRIPETYSLQPPLRLTAGSGTYSDRWVSQAGDEEYSNLLTKPMASLLSYQSDPEHSSGATALFNSSSGRWINSLGDTTVGLKLISRTEGLSIGSDAILDLFATSNITMLGTGDALSFLPIFSTVKDARPGKYSATFQLVNLGGGSALDSGYFNVDFEVVPEPGTVAALIAVGLVGLQVRRRQA